MLLRTIVFGISILSLSSTAHAQTWFAIDRAGDSAWYADGASVLIQDGVTAITYLQSYVSPEPPQPYHVKVAAEVRCASDEYRVMEVWGYDLPGREIVTDRGPGPWQRIHRLSMFAGIRDFACRREGGDPVADLYADAQDWRNTMLRARNSMPSGSTGW